MITGIVYANNTAYYEGNKIFNLTFKKKKNQVGTFSFKAYALDSTDLNNIKERNIVQILLNGKVMFEGYIRKVKYDRYNMMWDVEGESLEGILNTINTSNPVTLRMGYNGDLMTTKELVREVMFRLAGIRPTGPNGWSITGDDGVPLFFYRVEQRTVLDHIAALARLSNYTFRCYLK